MLKRISMVVLALVLLLMVGASAYYVYVDAEIDELNATTRQPFGGEYVNTTSGTTHYELAGDSSAPLVVLVHGLSIPSYVWRPTFDFLLAAGYRVLRYDHFGRGLSDRPNIRYHIDDYVQQLHEVMQALELKQPHHIIGLSMGGAVVTRFVNAYPEQVRRVILIDPLVEMPARPEIQLLQVPLLGEFMAKAVIVPKIEAGLAETVYDPAVFPDWHEQFGRQKAFNGFAQAIKRTLIALSQDNFIADYRQLGRQGKPIMLFWGKEDQVTPVAQSERLRELIPALEFHLIEQSGHLPHYEKPDQVNPLIRAFLSADSLAPI